MSLDRQAVEDEIAELERKAAALRQYLGEVPSDAEPVIPVVGPSGNEVKPRFDLRQRVVAKRTEAAPTSGNRPCGCGPTGRHRKGCSLAGSSVALAPKSARTGRVPFSEATYDKVRNKLEKDSEWEIVADMGLDAGEVSRIAESESYEEYAS